jgi:uncharacterized membrane protein YgcG
MQSEDMNKVPTFEWTSAGRMLTFLQDLSKYYRKHPASNLFFSRCLSSDAAMSTWRNFYEYNRDAVMPQEFQALPHNLPWEDSFGRADLLLNDPLVLQQLKITYNRAFRSMVSKEVRNIPCPTITSRPVFDKFLIQFNDGIEFIFLSHARRKDLLLDRLREHNRELYDMAKNILRDSRVPDDAAFTHIVDLIYGRLQDVTYISSAASSSHRSSGKADHKNGHGNKGNNNSFSGGGNNSGNQTSSGHGKSTERSRSYQQGKPSQDRPDSNAGSHDKAKHASQQKGRSPGGGHYGPQKPQGKQGDNRGGSPSPNQGANEKKKTDERKDEKKPKNDGQRAPKPKSSPKDN